MQQFFGTIQVLVSGEIWNDVNFADKLYDIDEGQCKGATFNTIHNLKSGLEVEEAGIEEADDNTALLRLLPLAILINPSDQKGLAIIKQVAEITHKSEEHFANIISLIHLIQKKEQNLMLSALRCTPDSRLKYMLSNSLDANRHVSTSIKHHKQNAGSKIYETLFFIYHVLHNNDSKKLKHLFADAIIHSGDTDIYCSIIGFILGYKYANKVEITSEWKKQLKQPILKEHLALYSEKLSRKLEAGSGILTLF